MVLDFYKRLKEQLQADQRVIVMVVIANEGSSPGRKGFKMAVSKNQMHGTIGGGIMEHKLVEYAHSLLGKPYFQPFLKKQIHDKSAPTDQSGMICSGWQTIAFYDSKDIAISSILSDVTEIHYTNSGVDSEFVNQGNIEWHFSETVAFPNKVYVVGGGHVGLALCEVLSRLDFEIHQLDHRENLNTMQANGFAHFQEVIDFESIEKHIPEGDDIYVVIMSFGYRTDEIIIRRLLGRNYKYLGMMGSKEKIATLNKNLIADGFDPDKINKVYAPIGVDIKSETTQEIAISVAAQLIQIKNQMPL